MDDVGQIAEQFSSNKNNALYALKAKVRAKLGPEVEFRKEETFR